jgi:ABC-type Na+ efflux pump permease subunit
MTNANPVAMPRTVAWLGYGGLVPFLLLALGSPLDPHHAALWNRALLSYGAIILSFVGALHWALAMTLPELSERQRSAWYAWSVAPALIAWPAMLISPRLAAPLLIAGFIAHYLQDRPLAGQAMLPAWYLPLRLRLTTVACVCLIGGRYAYA